MAFAWEPRGSRFAMIHAENPSSTKVNVSFYDMNKVTEVTTMSAVSKKSKTEVKEVAELNKVGTLEGKQCNSIFWSPAGGVILLASLGDQASGTLEFYDVDNKSLSIKEHYRANEVFWDPSGRTVATCVVQPIGGGHFKFSLDNGYILWSFQGKQLYQASFETFYQLQWRPRQRLLPKEEVCKVIKNIKKYEKRFDKEDKDRLRARHIEETRGKRQLRDAFRENIARLKAFHESQNALRRELMAGYDSNDESNYVMKEISVETVLSSKDEVVYSQSLNLSLQ
jgi:translation initiation factor 3 subunit B